MVSIFFHRCKSPFIINTGLLSIPCDNQFSLVFVDRTIWIMFGSKYSFNSYGMLILCLYNQAQSTILFYHFHLHFRGISILPSKKLFQHLLDHLKQHCTFHRFWLKALFHYLHLQFLYSLQLRSRIPHYHGFFGFKLVIIIILFL